VVAIIRLYIAWERSWVQYATTNQKNKKLWCRDLEHLDSIYTYIISGNRILSGEQGSRGAAGGAEFLKSGGVDTLLEREQTNRVTLPENWHSSLLHHRTSGTRHPLPPHVTLVLHHIIYDYLILYTYIYCQDLDIIVFVFGFFGLLLHIVLNSSLKLCTTWWWPPLWPKHVVVTYLPPYSYIIII